MNPRRLSMNPYELVFMIMFFVWISVGISLRCNCVSECNELRFVIKMCHLDNWSILIFFSLNVSLLVMVNYANERKVANYNFKL